VSNDVMAAPACDLQAHWAPSPGLSAAIAAAASNADSSTESSTDASRVQLAWAVLAEVPDPEVPAVSLCDLGIVRDVLLIAAPPGATSASLSTQGAASLDDVPPTRATLEVVLTPTYSGCPATEQIALAVLLAIEQSSLGPVRVRHQLAPAWTTDWITAQGRQKLLAYGIAPPEGEAAVASGSCGLGRPGGQLQPVPQVVSIRPRNIACPRCNSSRTERLSAFGSTACKALHRCLDCLEPFEYFKPL